MLCLPKLLHYQLIHEVMLLVERAPTHQFNPLILASFSKCKFTIVLILLDQGAFVVHIDLCLNMFEIMIFSGHFFRDFCHIV